MPSDKRSKTAPAHKLARETAEADISHEAAAGEVAQEAEPKETTFKRKKGERKEKPYRRIDWSSRDRTGGRGHHSPNGGHGHK